MKLIVANWKMYLTLRESIALANKVTRYTLHVTRYTIVLCPSFVAMEEVAKVIKGTQIKLGAQDVEPEKRGAYTGEVGLDDLRELGVEYVLVGHSERRRMGETDKLVNQKLKAVLKSGMRPILCVGESWKIRRSGKARGYVADQLRAGLKSVTQKDLKRVVVAYEPIWAIGTGRPDTPKDASEMHMWIQKIIRDISIFANKNRDVPILYGGSV
ncbi:triose-phosphate isomerase, partial [Candidatus Uhrbacteria bacterium RIFCSPLOWO2_12_FULL_47_10]